MSKQALSLLVLTIQFLAGGRSGVSAFSLRPRTARQSRTLLLGKEWSVGDDWERLSSENPRNSAPESQDIFNRDMARFAAFAMEQSQGAPVKEPSAEEVWIKSAIDQVNNVDEPNTETMSSHDGLPTERFLDDMGREISLLVRCNESPQDMLVEAGRALPPLSDEERNDPKQLVTLSDKQWEASPFLRESLATIFQQHSTTINGDGDGEETKLAVLDAAGVASWMSKAIGDGPVSQYKNGVASVLSTHGSYGKGYLTLESFELLYLKAIVGNIQGTDSESMWRKLGQRQSSIQQVWRDLRNHGILAPVEQERARLLEDIKTRHASLSGLSITVDDEADTLLDECEIIDESFTTSHTTDREGSSSHEDVKLGPDKKTPIWMRDGDFGKSS